MSLSSAAGSAASSAISSPSIAAAAHVNINHINRNNTVRKWVLKRRPRGVFDPDLDAELVTSQYEYESPELQTHTHTHTNTLSHTHQPPPPPLELGDTQVVVEPTMLSVDAFLRNIMADGAYHGSLPIGSTFPALGYGRVVQAGVRSRHRIGTTVAGMLEASDRVVVESNAVVRAIGLPIPGFPKHASLGLLGITCGMTAYCGVFCVASRPPRRGETVVVTGAAGAVGSIAVQLCQSTGARVVAVAGGPQKKEYLLQTLGCDGVIDYKCTDRSLREQIAETCPNGIDFVYDNVGGRVLNALLYNINANARVVICGAISQYSGKLHNNHNGNGDKTIHYDYDCCGAEGPSNYLKLAEKGAEMRGFNVMQHIAKLPLMLLGMVYLWARGKVTLAVHVEEGLERFPRALQKLFTGETIGKTLVRVRAD